MKNIIKRMLFIWLFPDGVFIQEDQCSQKISHTISVIRSDKTEWLMDAIHKGLKMKSPPHLSMDEILKDAKDG